jgi:hypothetical protein
LPLNISAVAKSASDVIFWVDKNNYTTELSAKLTSLCKGRANGLRYPRWGGRRDAVRLEKC